MRMLRRIFKFTGLLFIGFMFAVSMVLGVVPIVPKRKEQFDIEIKIDKIEKELDEKVNFTIGEQRQHDIN